MQCTTVKKGVNCSFMTQKGCGFNNGNCMPIIDDCQGCAKTINVDSGTYCNIVPNPSVKWRAGACSFATHVERKREEAVQKVNPLKASKRAAASKK